MRIGSLWRASFHSASKKSPNAITNYEIFLPSEWTSYTAHDIIPETSLGNRTCARWHSHYKSWMTGLHVWSYRSWNHPGNRTPGNRTCARWHSHYTSWMTGLHVWSYRSWNHPGNRTPGKRTCARWHSHYTSWMTGLHVWSYRSWNHPGNRTPGKRTWARWHSHYTIWMTGLHVWSYRSWNHPGNRTPGKRNVGKMTFALHNLNDRSAHMILLFMVSSRKYNCRQAYVC